MPTVVVEGDGQFSAGRHRLTAGKYETTDTALIADVISADLDWVYVIGDDGRISREVPQHVADDPHTYKTAEAPKEEPAGTMTTADFGRAEKMAAAKNADRPKKAKPANAEPALTDA